MDTQQQQFGRVNVGRFIIIIIFRQANIFRRTVTTWAHRLFESVGFDATPTQIYVKPFWNECWGILGVTPALTSS